MNSLAVRLVSFLSACLILLTAFHVMVSVSADDSIDVNDIVGEDTVLKRLTVSNVQASNPSSAVVNGTIHLAWIDGIEGDMTLRWKCSDNNGSSYSSDLSLTPSFERIADVSIDADDDSIVIVFCGTYNGTEGTYVVSSSNGGNAWSKASYLSNGTYADVIVHDGRAFVSLFREDNGTETFYIVRGTVPSSSSSALENCQAIFAMSVPRSDVEMIIVDNVIHFALVVDGTVVLGSADGNGIVDQPAAVWRGDDIAAVSLSPGEYGVEIWLAHNSVNGSSLRHSFVNGPYEPRTWEDVDVGADSYGNVSAASSNGQTMVAWDRIVDGESEVACALFDGGNVRYGPKAISNGTASSPVVIATDGFDIVFVQECERQELFSYRDVIFSRPNLERLISWTASQDGSVFYSADSRDDLVDDLNEVLAAFVSDDEKKAHSLISELRDEMDGLGDDAVHFNPMDLRSDDVRKTMESNLEYYSTADATEFASLDSGSQSGEMQDMVQLYIPYLDIYNLYGSSVEIYWETSLEASTEVMYGTTTEYGGLRIGESGTEHIIILDGLSPSTTYHIKLVSRSLADPNNVVESADMEFVTTSIGFQDLWLEYLSDSEVRIGVKTSVPAYVELYYWADGDHGDMVLEEGSNSIPVDEHIFQIPELRPDVVYSLQIFAYTSHWNDGDSSWSEEYTFMTNNVTINSITVDITGPDTAEISWVSLGEYYESFVFYGDIIVYENMNQFLDYDGYSQYTAYLTDLAPDTLYLFKILMYYQNYHDPSGWAMVESDDRTFTIRSIDNLSITVGPATVQMDWNTSFLSSTEIYYLDDAEWLYWCSENLYSGRDILGRHGLSSAGEFGTSHSATLSGLEANTTYHLKVISRSPYDPNEVAVSEEFVISTGINNVVVSPGIDGSVNITWTTGVAATTEVHYGITDDYGGIVSGHSGTSHSVTITGLPSNSLCHFQIASASLSDPRITFRTDDATFRTAAMAISDVTCTTGSSIQLAWTTNIEGTTELHWGLDASYGNIVTGAVGTSHSATLENLASNTTYYFKAVSRSATNQSDIAQSNGMTFIAIGMYGLAVVTSADEARISWTTNVESTTEVHWGTTASYGNIVTGPSGTSHSVTLIGLASATAYHLKVISRSSQYPNAIVQSDDTIFVTAGASISDVSIAYVGFSTARIEWTSSIDATSILRYGTTVDCGSYVAGSSGTSHSVTITDLVPGTAYYFKVGSASTSNPYDVAYSSVNGFVTYDLENIVVEKLDLTSVRITWTTAIVGTSEVLYGTAVGYGSSAQGSAGTTHSVTMANLIPGATYHFKVVSRSPQDHSDLSESADRTFTIGAISNVVVDVGISTARITWTTDVPTTSEVAYGTTTAYGSSKQGTAGTTHSVTISGLSSSATYHFKVISRSASDPSVLVQSGDGTFTTLQGNDAGTNEDAGNLGDPMLIAPGIIDGNLNRLDDLRDCYYFKVLDGQVIDISLDVPSGFDYDLYVYNPFWPQIRTVFSSCTRGSDDEHMTLQLYFGGPLRVAVQHHSGTGVGQYSLTIRVSSTEVDMDGGFVDYSNPPDPVKFINGFDLYEGWASSGVPRSGADDATILFSVYDNTYQMNTDYLLTFRYYSTQNSIVQVYNGAGWVNLGTLPGRTAISTASVVVPCEYFYDSIPDVAGMNIMLRLTNATLLHDIGFVAYSYSVDASEIDSANVPGVLFGTGWNASGGIVNGTSGATVIVSVPLTDIDYSLQFEYSSDDEVTVQQYTSSGWSTIGVLRNHGGSSTVIMSTDYHDSDAGQPGINILIRILGTLHNVSSITMRPCSSTTDVGGSGDADDLKHLFGASIVTSSWSVSTTLDNRSVRTTSGSDARFLLNAPVSGQNYRIDITYKTSAAGKVQQYTEDGWIDVLVLNPNGNWNYDSFWIENTVAGQWQYYYSSLLFRITSSGTAVDSIIVHIDSDGDTLLDVEEAACVGGALFSSSSVPNAYNAVFEVPIDSYYGISFDVYFGANSICRLTLDGTIIYDKIGLDAIVETGSQLVHARLSAYLSPGTHTLSFSSLHASVTNLYIYRSLGTDPFSADTDSDNLRDDVELSMGTDPTNPDTDGDGLLDGNEQWSQTWSADGSPKIIDQDAISISVRMPSFTSTERTPITALNLHLGITHTWIGDLHITLFHGSKYAILWNRQGGSADQIYKSYDLLQSGWFTVSDLTSTSAWTLFIEDCAGGDIGRLEYFNLQVTGGSDPLVQDTDGDGIWDGEEVNLGEDGWITNPVLTDTDSDGISDRNEIISNTPCGKALDPTNPDTDGDGFKDNVDRALGDRMVKITITQFKALETLWSNTIIPAMNNDPRVFFTISADGYFYSTPRTTYHVGDSYTVTDRIYYIDVYDSNATVTVTVNAWADDPFVLEGDRLLDIGPSGTYGLVYTFNLDSLIATKFSSGGPDGGKDDAEITIKLESVVQPRTNTVVVYGTADGEDYGIYQVGDKYRYQSDDQVYILYLECTSSYGNFLAGLNTVVLPRSVAVSSQLNSVLTGAIPLSGTALNGAAFYSDDGSAYSKSGSIIAMLSLSGISGQRANDILTLITRDPSNAQVGKAMTVSSGDLYLMNLPTDVLFSIPLKNFSNSPIDDLPATWQSLFYNTVVTVADFMYHALIDRQFIPSLVASVVVLGLHKIADMVNTVSQAVKTIANKIVDAFDAFVTWAIEFMEDTLETLFGPIINTIKNAVNAYCSGLSGAWSMALIEYEQTGSVSPSILAQFGQALRGDLFWILFGVTVVINAALIALSVVTNVWGFLLGMAISLIVEIIVSQAFSAQQSAQGSIGMTGGSAPEGSIDLEQFGTELAGSGVDTSGSTWATVWGTFGCLATTFSLAIGYGAWHDGGLSKLGKISLVVGSLALGVAIFSVGIGDPMLSMVMSVTAAAMGVVSLGISLAELIGGGVPPNAVTSAWLSAIINGIAIGVSLIGVSVSIQNLLNQEG